MLTRGSLKRKGAPALDMTSPANDLYDLSIHRLIRRGHWSAIIERVRAHPEVIRKTTPCINGGYYTILHFIMRRGPSDMTCQDVAPVIKAILTAADETIILQSESRRNRWRAVHGHYSSTTIIMKVCLHSIFCVKALRFGAMSQ